MKALLTLFLISLAFVGYSQHSVILKTGEKIEGVVMELKDDVVTIYVDRKPKKIPLKEIKSMFFDEYVPYDGSLTDDAPVKKIKSLDGDYMLEYQVKDREMIQAPKVSNATEKKGKVVVEVEINRAGTVMNVKAGVVGSTTSDEYLLTKAEYACMGAKFNEHATGPLKTKGTITINY